MLSDFIKKFAIIRIAQLANRVINSGRNESSNARRKNQPPSAELLEGRATPATLHWLGSAGTSGKQWDVPANWLENAVPASGSTLIFDSTVPGFSATANGFAPVNNIGGLSNLTLVFNDASTSGDFSVTGLPIGLRSTAGIGIDSTVSSGTAVTVSTELSLASNTTFRTNLGILTTDGIISDAINSYSITLSNTPTTQINLSGANTYDGGTFLSAGTLGVALNTSLGVGPLTMTGGTLMNLNGFVTLANPVVINASATFGGGGFFTLNGNIVLNADLTATNTGFLTLNGVLSGSGGFIENGFPGSTTFGGTQPNTFTGPSSIISGAISLKKTAGVTAWAAPISISGGFNNLNIQTDNQIADNVAITLLAGGNLNLSGHADSILSLNSPTSGNVDPGSGLIILGGGTQTYVGTFQGAGTLTYAGSGTLSLFGASTTFTGTFIAANGVLSVSANYPAATVSLQGGMLVGTGVVKAIVPSSGAISPGGPGNQGILTIAAAASALANLKYQVDINDPLGNDQLVVGNGASLNLNSATLDLNIINSTTGNVYTIVSSPSGSIIGTFAGLPSGTIIVKGGQSYLINYSASAVTLVNQANGISQLHWIGSTSVSGKQWDNPANWLENAIPVSGSTLIFDTTVPGFSVTANGFAPVNNIAGLSNLTLVFNDASTAGDFSVTGLPIGLRLTAGIGIDSTVTSGTAVTVSTELNLASNTTFRTNLGNLTTDGIISDTINSYSVTLSNTPTTQINLSGGNTYDGGTFLSAGTLGVALNTSLGVGPLTMTGGTLMNLNGFVTLANPVVINAPATIGGGGFFTLNGNIVLNADLTATNSGFLTLNGVLSGSGGFIENGFPGSTTFGGTQPNTFTGPSSIISGAISLKKTAGVTALAAPISISGGFNNLNIQTDNQIADNVAITLLAGGNLNLSGHADSILSLNSPTSGNVDPGSGLIILGGGTQTYVGTFQGAGTLTYAGSGTLSLFGASTTFTGTFIAANGVLSVSANYPAATVSLQGGMLVGTGVVKAIVPSSGAISPGGPGNQGILTIAAAASALANLKYQVDINDPLGNDQLVVSNGASLNLNSATLDLNIINSTTGNVYTIVSSPSGGIIGTFAGLPSGTIIVKGGQSYQINYSPSAVTLVNQVYGISPLAAPAGDVGVTYNQTLRVTGGTRPYASVQISNFNGGGTGLTGANIAVDANTGVITINGTATALGIAAFTINVTDSAGSMLSRNYAITFNAAPTITPATLPDGAFGVAYTNVVTASGGSAPFTALTVSGFNGGGTGIAAPNVNLAAGSVTFNSVPTATGTVSFTVSAIDAAGASATKSFTFNVGKTNSQVALTSSVSASAVFGQPITLTAIVSPTPPAVGAASGSVTFFDGATSIGTVSLNGSGVATLQTAAFTFGSHTITAVYAGNANLSGNTSNALTQVVAKANSSIALSANANPAVFGQAATYSATVSAVAPGAGVPTGSVTIFDGAAPVGSGSLNAAGIATVSIASLSVGAHSIVAVYVGDSNFNGSTSSSINQTVNQAATTNVLIATPNATTGGMLVTLKATISPTAPGAGIPSGTVDFIDGSTSLGTASLDPTGAALLTTTTLAAGSHLIVANYAGSGNFLPSTSNSQTVTVATDAAPHVQSVTLNSNVPALAGPQHSRVASLVVTFDRPVLLDTSALALTLHTNNVTFAGVPEPAGRGVLPDSLMLATLDNVTWVVTFSGNTETGVDGFASLQDGVYDLNIAAVKVHPVGSPAINMAANQTTTFYRLFGDTDAPSTPSGGTPGADFSAIVNSGDNLNFRGAFNNTANYKAFLDFTGDGTIVSGDNLQFRNRFNKALTWRT